MVSCVPKFVPALLEFCAPPVCLCFGIAYLFEFFVRKHKQGWLVGWVERASLDRIRWLLEITERKRNHELLLSVKNLRELGASPFRYIVPVIPRSLPEELVKGEHFVLADLLKLISDNSSQTGPVQEPRAKVAVRGLVSFVRPDQSPLLE